jgi:hypothetical protein
MLVLVFLLIFFLCKWLEMSQNRQIFLNFIWRKYFENHDMCPQGRHQRRAGRGRGHRGAEASVRHLGQHGQRGEQDGLDGVAQSHTGIDGRRIDYLDTPFAIHL